MKKTNKFLISSLLTTVLFFALTGVVYGQTNDYITLAPLPNTTNCGPNPGVAQSGTNCTTNLQTYLPNAFDLAIGVAAVMAFVMITFGGIMYATSDALSGKSQGRTYIEDAIIGLLLVIGSWVILNTINPQILNFNLTTPPPTIATTSPTVAAGTYGPCCTYTKNSRGVNILNWYTMTPAEIQLNINMRQDLMNNHNIAVNNGPCTTPGVNTGCTNLIGLSGVVYAGLDALRSKQGCNCQLTITGGTEGGHASHKPGNPIVDLAATQPLTDFIINEAKKRGITPTQTSLGPKYTLSINGRIADYLQESNPPHWHVEFK